MFLQYYNNFLRLSMLKTYCGCTSRYLSKISFSISGDQIAAIQKRKAAAAASSTSAVNSFSAQSSHHCTAPLKLYLAISMINITLLVPFLLSQLSSVTADISLDSEMISNIPAFPSPLSPVHSISPHKPCGNSTYRQPRFTPLLEQSITHH